MRRRFIITGVVIAALLGGLAYFQFVYKPQMIRSFLSQMKPPPATVTAEPARTEKWVERLTSIGTLIASQGVDVTSQVAGIITDVQIDSGKEIEQGAKLVQLDISVELADLASAVATHREAEVAYARQTDLMTKKVTSEANLDTARAKQETAQAAVKRIEAVIAQKGIAAPFSGRVGIRKVEKGPVRVGRHGAGLAAGARPHPRRLPDARAAHRQAARGRGHRAHRRCVSRPGLQGRDPIARCARRPGHAHAAGAGHPSQQGAQAAAGHVRQRGRAGGRGRRCRHRSEDGGHLQPLRRQRLRREAGAGQGGGGATGRGRPACRRAARRRAPLRAHRPGARGPRRHNLRPRRRRAGHHHRASSSSTRELRSISTTRSPSPRPKRGRNCRAAPCRSPTSSFAAPCSPPS